MSDSTAHLKMIQMKSTSTNQQHSHSRCTIVFCINILTPCFFRAGHVTCSGHTTFDGGALRHAPLRLLDLELGPVFANLFQQSINTGEIPKEWSLANICPLFKKGDRSLACNYRPVSLTCIPCKLLEHIVCSNIMGHLGQYNLLSDKQHAFRKWHSCETQLITVINDWAKILDKKGQVDTFILDFEKAFDTPHPP